MQSPFGRTLRRDRKHPGFAWDHLELAHTLLDEDVLHIFRSTSGEATTAVGLSRRLRMPLARTNRWLRRLESLGLIVSTNGRPGKAGKPSRLYRSALQSVCVRVEDAGVRTRIAINAGSTALVSETTTTWISPETADAPEVRLESRSSGEEVVFHFVDPSGMKRGPPPGVPINLPAFLRDPLPLRRERR